MNWLKYFNPFYGLGTSNVGTDEDSSRAPLIAHLTELRGRLLAFFAVFMVLIVAGFVIAKPLYQIVARPLAYALEANGQPLNLYALSVFEQIFTDMNLALFFAMIVSLPLLLMQIWGFVAPGLYKRERGAFGPFLIASPILFWLGVALAYYVVMPYAFEFLIRYTVGDAARLEAVAEAGQTDATEWTKIMINSVSAYLRETQRMILAFGIAFQVPVLMALLNRSGLVSADAFANNRRYAILIVAIASGVLTPPDPGTMALLAVPMYGLFEGSIILARMFERRNPHVFGLDEDLEAFAAEEAEKAAASKEES